MRLDINIEDSISPAIEYALRNNESYLRHITKSVGWWFQKTTKEEIKLDTVGGDHFARRTPYLKVRKKLDRRAPTSWYGRMRRAIGYEYDNGGVNIGWTSVTAAHLGDLLESGFTRQITSSIRSKYAAAGVPLSNKPEIDTPARPVFDPMYEELRPQIPSYVEKQVVSYMEEKVEYGKKNRRKYKVYNV